MNNFEYEIDRILTFSVPICFTVHHIDKSKQYSKRVLRNGDVAHAEKYHRKKIVTIGYFTKM